MYFFLISASVAVPHVSKRSSRCLTAPNQDAPPLSGIGMFRDEAQAAASFDTEFPSSTTKCAAFIISLISVDVSLSSRLDNTPISLNRTPFSREKIQPASAAAKICFDAAPLGLFAFSLSAVDSLSTARPDGTTATPKDFNAAAIPNTAPAFSTRGMTSSTRPASTLPRGAVAVAAPAQSRTPSKTYSGASSTSDPPSRGRVSGWSTRDWAAYPATPSWTLSNILARLCT
mmetsp:Transcript_11107/g.16806  ORF Transcript_11107/g.16806 Transcript_11107/m.16806 type:complete len:230 (+) Transcript_11107:580-1269(+)